MSPRINQRVIVPRTLTGTRFDQIAAELFPDYSRSRLKSWINSGELVVNSRKAKPNSKLSGGELLTLDAEPEQSEQWCAEDIDLDIVFEDQCLMVVNKPVGLVVHPAAGNWSGTLMNGLLFHRPELAHIPRAGIVHRLDKDTSGLMVVSLTLEAQLSLVEQLQERSVARTYHALVHGVPNRQGNVDEPIGRHPAQRTKMAVRGAGAKEARTHYQLLDSYQDFSLMQLKLETGRTHQIRVHMAHMGFPLVGDQVYGRKSTKRELERLPLAGSFARQALHAKALGLRHPESNQTMSWEIDLPKDMDDLLTYLRSSG